MSPTYSVRDTASLYSPALLFYKDLIRKNVARAVELAGGPDRLRPHVKTHKTREIVRLALDAGITKHKCATLAEAEMLAGCGVKDVLVAYPLVGPNRARLTRLVRDYPNCQFSVTVDDPDAARALSAALAAEGQKVEALVDLDVGQHRTGVAPGPAAAALYEEIARLPGLRPGGFQLYDGHNRDPDPVERAAAVRALLEPVLALRDRLDRNGLPTPRLVAGGTPTFPVYASMELPGLECSPGTLFLHDQGYGSRFPDVSGFTPAALLLTRVVSRPTPTRVTFDLGHKAVAADPPAGERVALLGVPDFHPVNHSEEHLTVETPVAARFRPGDEVLAVPGHVCPTVALHRQAMVVEGGAVVGTWEIAARDRVLRP